MRIISFHPLDAQFRGKVIQWLDEPHVREFWDNSPEHRHDIDNFINGRIEPSSYFNGSISYWVGLMDDEPFCFLLTSNLSDDEDLPITHKTFLSKTGNTTTLDFCIGNTDYMGKGLAAKTLKAFMQFYVSEVDSKTDLFFIDPDESNPRAKHVYEKAGFREVAQFEKPDGYFKGQTTYLMTCRVLDEVRLVPASMNYYSVVQNLARFYVYDISHNSSGDPFFNTPDDGIFECFDLVNYFTEEGRYAFLVRVGEELAGFVLLHTFDDGFDWSMGEFYIVGKYQGQGVGCQVAKEIFRKFPGSWSLTAIPENKPAIDFWDAVISQHTCGQYEKSFQLVESPKDNKEYSKIVWQFTTRNP